MIKTPVFSPALQLIIAVALISAMLQGAMHQFIYLRDIMLTEPWRWWTAHWVHVGWRHYLLNILAFCFLPFIFPHISRKTLIACLLILPPMLSLDIYLFMPDVYAYAGLSGILHGIYIVAAIEAIQFKAEQKFAVIVLVCISLKIGWEKWLGHSETAQLIQAPVLIEAHQFGSLSGVLLAIIKHIIGYLGFKKSLNKL